MSDPVNKPRQPVDLDEFERRLRGGEPSFPAAPAFGAADPYAPPMQGQYQPQMPMPPQPSYAPQMNDPLAELARIVDGPRPAPFGQRAEPTLPRATPLGAGWDSHEDADLHPDLRGGGYGSQELPPYPQAQQQQQQQQQYSGTSWPADDQGWDVPEEAPPRRSSKKLLLMGAAALVVVGGIGATFATRSGPSGKSDVPTIKAQTGPMKVTPEPSTTASANTSDAARTASVLDRNNTERLNTSRVVNNVEQPVDLSQVRTAPTQPATASTGTTDQGANAQRQGGIFPDPIKVKTVSVRPDGTIVTAVTTPTPPPVSLAPAAPAPRQVSSTPTGSTPSPAPARAAAPAPAPAPAPAAAPAPAPSPKSTERATSTPLPVPGTGSSTSSDLPRQLASAQPAPTRAAAPAPAPAAAAPSGSGGYAVQFSAAASEQEAREKIAATQRRFADALGGRTPTFIKGEAGSRTVWRVRVGGMSRDEASSMCQRIKGQGGDCFVAAN